MSESSTNLDQNLAALQQLQHENANLRNSVQERQAATIVTPHPIIDHFAVEPNVSLPHKFDGTRSCLRGFINQIRQTPHRVDGADTFYQQENSNVQLQ